MTLRIIFLELEFASRKDGDHQQPAALAVPTLLGAGRQGREGTENSNVPTAKAERPEEANQVEHLEEEGNAIQLECEQTRGQALAWTMPT